MTRDIFYFKKAFRGYLKRHSKAYKKISFKIIFLNLYLSIKYDERENILYIYPSKSTKSSLLHGLMIILFSYAGFDTLIQKHLTILKKHINPQTKILMMGECGENIFFNVLFQKYHHIFPNKQNIYLLILAPPKIVSYQKYITQMISLNIHFLIFRVKTDRIQTKKFDQTFKKHIVFLNEIKELKRHLWQWDDLVKGNHHTRHHIQTIWRYFKSKS